MKKIKIISYFKVIILMAIVCFSINNTMAQNYSVTIKVNHLPVIVAQTPSSGPSTYDVCKYATLNLKTLYVDHVDTNGTPLADTEYTLIFSELSDFSIPISGPDYQYILMANSKTIYAKVTTNTTSCTKDFSFELNAKPEPTFATSLISSCYGVNIDLNTAVGTITNGGATPLTEFSLDSTSFTAIASPSNYDANVLGTKSGGDYKLFARVKNEETGCYSLAMPFILHIDTMPTLVLSAAATSGTTEICDGTTINLEDYVTSTNPVTGVTLEFSIGDANFSPALSATAATAYTLAMNNTTQESLSIYVRGKMNTTNCVSIGTEVKDFTLLINPMPTLVLDVNADGAKVCDTTIINLESYVSTHTLGSALQFSLTSDFATIIEGTDATAYTLNEGNTTPLNRKFFVRAKIASSNCVSVSNAIKDFTLEINPVPTMQTITAGFAYACSKNIITYEVPSQSNVSYVWSADGGAVQGTLGNAKDSVLWGNANANAKVQVVYTLNTSGKMCSRTANLDVDVKQSPTEVNLETVSGNAETCDDGTNQIQLRATVTDGAPNFTIDYSWSPDNGNTSVTTTINTATFNVHPANNGINYTYKINKVTDNLGCKLIIP